jgi:hypothetical protein
MKPATRKVRALLAKLTALAERGINGERANAQKKLARLQKRYDFTAPDLTATMDIFAGVFKPASYALRVHRFDNNESDIANAVKWAIEQRTGIQCSFRDGTKLYADAMPDTAENLGKIAATVAQTFSELWKQYSALGANPLDRSVFVMGLFDGMQGESRAAGQPLPQRATVCRIKNRKKRAVSLAPGLSLHPYTTAAGLGRQIAFNVPLDKLTEELNNMAAKQLPA